MVPNTPINTTSTCSMTGVAKIMGAKNGECSRHAMGYCGSIASPGMPIIGTVLVFHLHSGFVPERISPRPTNRTSAIDTGALVDGLVDPIVQINHRGINQLANETTCSLFGYSRDEMIGSNISMSCRGSIKIITTNNF